jgi:16S rRNA (adenine1518-N6/adenine1519-N6)-dimethyltransferase
MPKKSLGQHFLVDENILGVIGRLAELGPDDVVLEIGPGEGVLTRYLATRVSTVHAIELDDSLEPVLRQTLVAHTNVNLVFGDAVRLDYTLLEPAAGKLVANLPYNVATPVVVESLLGANAIRHWCVMVQREVADRLFAQPSTKAYGAVSVLVQLTARRTGWHPVPPTVFRPRPRVDSALVAFARIDPPVRLHAVRAVVEGAFSHRRKTLPNALELADVAPRSAGAAALRAIGRPSETRAEVLAPSEFVALAAALDAE